MTEHNVLVFGSFTEDEIKSLNITPNENENDVQFMFGSVDSATLRSVGFINNKPNEIKISKDHQPSKLLKKREADEIVHPNAKDSQNLVSVEHQNGNICDSSSISFSNGMKLQEQIDAELPVSFVPESVGGIEDMTVSSSNKEQVAFVRSYEAMGLNDTQNSILTASNGQHTALTELLPRGLVNPGNLCFLNATLQAILACSPFVHLLQELRTRNIPQIGYPTLRAFVDFISGFDMPSDIHSKKKDDIILKTGNPLRPVMFESVLNNFSPDMPNSFLGRPRQEDAQEFLSFLMHQMHDELLKFEGGLPLVNGGKVSLVSSVSDEDGDSWETVGPRNKTAITRTQSFIPSKLSKIFGGQLKSVVKARGNKASATIQPFLLLHLNICPEPVRTIEDALHIFSASETLEGYRASSAGKAELVSASKSVKVLELPEILILHLMRFSYGSQGSAKLSKPVYFPLELVLNRDLLVLSTAEGRKYELVATVTHHGREPSKGHYTADVLHHPSGKWLRYDDASVVAISTNKVLHDQAYVLFYKQL
ncbi:ubiquitin carboxyl-terminal hydrolase 24-like [Rutidosis leptorrhynchoides]|uniref:ubiquitin carboxyl-terminal hydrolase 24-like n=1 Tax=Rutidosis leptorrhynchoides TaxID=125765 RepID=UPI003A9A60B6